MINLKEDCHLVNYTLYNHTDTQRCTSYIETFNLEALVIIPRRTPIRPCYTQQPALIVLPFAYLFRTPNNTSHKHSYT